MNQMKCFLCLQLRLENVKAGRKGNLNVATEVCEQSKLNGFSWWFVTCVIVSCLSNNLRWLNQIFQMAPSLHMVEVRKAKGDTLEFHKVPSSHKILMLAII